MDWRGDATCRFNFPICGKIAFNSLDVTVLEDRLARHTRPFGIAFGCVGGGRYFLIFRRPKLSTDAPRVIEVGKCIYCRDSNTTELTREHVMPRALGGGLILRGASCRMHQRMTHEFETDYLRSGIRIFRYIRGLPVGNKKERPTHLPLILDFGTHREARFVPVADYPDVLFMPIFKDAPGIFRDGQKGKAEISHMRSCHNSDAFKKVLQSFKAQSFVIPGGVPEESFIRTLAKIAHGIAISEFGFRFEPLLLDIIEGNVSEAGWVIGKGSELTKPERHNSHMFAHRIITEEGISLIVITLHLFAGLMAPSYCLVAGAFDSNRPPPQPAWPEMAKITTSTQNG